MAANVKESVIQRTIIDGANWLGGLALRLNSGKIDYDQRLPGGGSRHVHIELCPEGTPDLLLLLPGGTALWVETKTKTGKLRPSQVLFHERLRELGQKVIIGRSFDDVLLALGYEAPFAIVPSAYNQEEFSSAPEPQPVKKYEHEEVKPPKPKTPRKKETAGIAKSTSRAPGSAFAGRKKKPRQTRRASA